MSHVRRAGIAGVMAAALAATTFVAPSTAQASRHVIASTKAVGNPESEGLGNVAVRPNGRAALVLSSAGLTKYAISGTSVRRLGTTKIWKDDYANRPQVHIHPGGAIAYVVWDKAIRVFDITGSKPRAIRTVQLDEIFGDRSTFAWEGEFAADGQHFYILGDNWLQVLDTAHPGRPTRGKGLATADGVRVESLSLTPNGAALAVGGAAEERARILLYSLKNSAAPVLARQGVLEVAGWTADSSTFVDGLVARNDQIYVGVATWRESRDAHETALLRVRRSDLAVVGQVNEGEDGSPSLPRSRPGGGLVYLTYGHTSDEAVHQPQHLVRANPKLGATHALTGVGDIAHFAVSPGGRTKGLLAVIVRTGTGTSATGLIFKLVNPR